MRILFLGDVMGRSGREAIARRLPSLREEWRLDFVVANGENATQGNGLTPAHAKDLLSSGIDCITLGDHAFDQRQMIQFAESEPRIVTPLNFARAAPGKGARVYTADRLKRILVVSALGRVFMKQPFDDPFLRVSQALDQHPLGSAVDAAIVDFHAEATSEKMAMGHWCDGRASLVAGTHTHVPTADAKILAEGTGYISDVGMCGDYNSVIGVRKEEPMRRFTTGMSGGKLEPSNGEASICGIFVETRPDSGLARRTAPIRVGGDLPQAGP